jgi:hypothetical protein
MQPPEQLSLRAPTPPRASSHDSSMSTSRKPNPSLTNLLGVPGAAGAVVVGAMAANQNVANKIVSHKIEGKSVGQAAVIKSTAVAV